MGVDRSYCSIGPSVFLGVVYSRSRASVGGIGSLGSLAYEINNGSIAVRPLAQSAERFRGREKVYGRIREGAR